MSLHGIKNEVKRSLKLVRAETFRALNRNKQYFSCPICAYRGPFMDALDPTGKRENAMCPACSSVERHRVFWLTLERLPERARFSRMSLLHFAPEPQLEPILRRMFCRYETADLFARGVDHKVDMRNLPFKSGSYDMVIASHVLEHIKEDEQALRSIHRVLKPGGLAILQVPVIGANTVEYPEPNRYEWGHVRAPGEDYFDRYEGVFRRVEKFRSSQFEERFQPFIFEDRTQWPKRYPLRPKSKGLRHEDIVPVCYT